MQLGINVDHVATIRQQRFTSYPSPVRLALLAEQAGADLITMHLREDRRHIQSEDVTEFMAQKTTILNLEMAITEPMLAFACGVCPEHCCLVPEKRQELTTEGGLDVQSRQPMVRAAVERLAAHNIEVSLFIDPDQAQVDAAVACGAPTIEIHTGSYAENPSEAEYNKILTTARYAKQCGLTVNAGHGLNYENVGRIASIADISELNIGHAVVAYAVGVGIAEAVKQMRRRIA